MFPRGPTDRPNTHLVCNGYKGTPAKWIGRKNCRFNLGGLPHVSRSTMLKFQHHYASAYLEEPCFHFLNVCRGGREVSLLRYVIVAITPRAPIVFTIEIETARITSAIKRAAGSCVVCVYHNPCCPTAKVDVRCAIPTVCCYATMASASTYITFFPIFKYIELIDF